MNNVILSPSLSSRINSAKNLSRDGQMLHSFDFVQDRFVQHDNPSNKLRQTTIYLRQSLQTSIAECTDDVIDADLVCRVRRKVAAEIEQCRWSA
jgi:hypothetical protein